MLWRDQVGLISVTTEKNKYREEEQIDSEPRMVFANKKSVRQSEFYQAAAVGKKPEVVFEVQTIEYNDEPKLVFGEITYYITRTFSKNAERTELVCSRFPMEG
ncbi:hypothetical protein [Paenibacillus sp. FSL L8-0708]|uniref:hypothetical protein n=1 Tax=Paenibacillus sp. FSL L8-0708 TaxID=2975311 RepID=UPI0030F6E94B